MELIGKHRLLLQSFLPDWTIALDASSMLQREISRFGCRGSDYSIRANRVDTPTRTDG